MKAKDVRIGSLLWCRQRNWVLLVVNRVEFVASPGTCCYWKILFEDRIGNLYESSLDMYEELNDF